MYVFFLIKQIQIKQGKIGLQYHLLIKHLLLQGSLLSSFTFNEEKIKPINNIITATMADAIDRLKSSSFLTIGWTIAKIIIAIDKFIRPFPTSFNPFIQSIIKYYHN